MKRDWTAGKDALRWLRGRSRRQLQGLAALAMVAAGIVVVTLFSMLRRSPERVEARGGGYARGIEKRAPLLGVEGPEHVGLGLAQRAREIAVVHGAPVDERIGEGLQPGARRLGPFLDVQPGAQAGRARVLAQAAAPAAGLPDLALRPRRDSLLDEDVAAALARHAGDVALARKAPKSVPGSSTPVGASPPIQ